MLEVNNLEIHSKSTGETLVKSVSFSVGPGETLGLIGESGSGKSMTSKCIMRLLDPGLFDMTGSIRWKGAEILTKKSGAPKGYRGRQVGMITQNPMTAFAPMIKLGKQLEMGFDLKGRAARREFYDRFDTALTGVNLHDTKKILNSYPDELSGGMLQRVMIALTMMQKPELLIADECTTAVDAASEYLILGELENMAKLYFDNMRPTLGMSANYGQLDMLITEITADDEYTVSFHLARPYYNVLNDLSMVMPRGILSAAAFNEDGSTNDEYLMTHTPGTGPYMFESVNDTATEYTFVRNPYYWGEAPDVDRFKVVIIPESKVAAMRSGNVDFIIGSETLDAESFKELSAADGITGIVSDFDFVTEFIALNDDIAGLDDINVRTAIQMALDKNAVAESIYSGLRTAADSVMPADMPFCKYDVTCPGYDPEGAVKLLDDNGWLDSDGNGIRDKDGTELSFTITYPATGVYDNVVLYYQATMQELGIEVKTEPLDLMTFFNQIFSEVKYDMTAYMSYWFPYDPYTFVANMYPSTDYMAADGIYSTDPQVAKAIATMNEEDAKTLIAGLYQYDDIAKIQEIYTKALNSANESSVIIPLNYRNEYAVFNSDKIASYTFNSIPNHVDVAAVKLK